MISGMFSGIITHLGKVNEKTESTLVINAPSELLEKFAKGLSISINGICFTVVNFSKTEFVVEYMPETAKVTALGSLHPGDPVNLELPVTPETFLAGHMVQGHVDCVGVIESVNQEGNSRLFKFSIPSEISKYIVKKGSVAVNGISLTVIDSGENYFSVGIIPHTWEKTMLHVSKPGDQVNIEVDMMAKYIEKLIRNHSLS